MSNGRPWSPEDISRLRRLVASGMTDSQIARQMGRCRVNVCGKRRELGISPGQAWKLRTIIINTRMRARMRARV